ncbi:MAG: hypothetical protein HZA61_03780 [Candidatus Eisenbacteria bacterium]|uniref:OmpH family outer membrane protein n=1 Tax=Eiseniibacteriota bacterium TaxID=2212470 RepID=A0A933SB75_UNCEI|nr:hypothetical protein [Candidatus Eisenbacteria bacterium]
MHLRLALAVSLTLVAALATPAGAPSAGAPPTSAAALARPVGPTGVVLPAADPMAADLQRAIERNQREYAALFGQLARARDEREAFAIQDEMRQSRTGLQIELLRIQAAYARRAGREELAYEFDRTVEALIRH